MSGDISNGAPHVSGIRFRGVSKWFGQVSALSDVSVDLAHGVVGLVGHNGAGKSTFMKLASGLVRPSQGDVLIAGGDPADPVVRHRLGMSPDFDALHENMTGQEWLAWMLRLGGVARTAARRRAADLLDELGLGEPMGRKIRTYSKGMRQRVRLAQALAHRPDVVLLDEPMTGLDPLARRELGELVRELGARRGLVLISSHVLHELQSLVDRVVLVHQGRLLADGTVRELRQQLDDRPLRILLKGEAPRPLAAALATMDGVEGVALADGGVEVSVSSGTSAYPAITALAGERPGWVQSMEPLDDSLAAVFGYLTHG